jgi:hypothetical protein
MVQYSGCSLFTKIERDQPGYIRACYIDVCKLRDRTADRFDAPFNRVDRVRIGLRFCTKMTGAYVPRAHRDRSYTHVFQVPSGLALENQNIGSFIMHKGVYIYAQ